MRVPIAHTSEGIEVLLTDEHPASIMRLLPCVALGDGPGAVVMGKSDRVQTERGLFSTARLVVDWLKQGPDRSKEERALAIRFLKDAPEYL